MYYSSINDNTSGIDRLGSAVPDLNLTRYLI